MPECNEPMVMMGLMAIVELADQTGIVGNAGFLEQPANSEASSAATISDVQFFINVNDA
jgi:hypothetical protein